MPRSAPSPGRRRRLRRLLRRKQLLLETELGEIADAAEIKHAVEKITFVLHHARVKSAYLAHEMAAVLVVTGVTQMGVARHQTAQAGHAETALPVLLHLVAQELEGWVDQHSGGHRFRIGITGIGFDPACRQALN